MLAALPVVILVTSQGEIWQLDSQGEEERDPRSHSRNADLCFSAL